MRPSQSCELSPSRTPCGSPAWQAGGLPLCPRGWPGLSESGLLLPPGYTRTGSIFLAQTQDRLISLKRINSRLKYV